MGGGFEVRLFAFDYFTCWSKCLKVPHEFILFQDLIAGYLIELIKQPVFYCDKDFRRGAGLGVDEPIGIAGIPSNALDMVWSSFPYLPILEKFYVVLVFKGDREIHLDEVDQILVVNDSGCHLV